LNGGFIIILKNYHLTENSTMTDSIILNPFLLAKQIKTALLNKIISTA